MKKCHLILFMAIIAILTACSTNQEQTDYVGKSSEIVSAQADTVAISAPTTSIDANKKRKFIRTADVKFKTNDVRKTTYSIEKITTSFGGFIIHNDLQSNIIKKVRKQISADSLVEITTFTVENNISLRVPNRFVDTLLRSLNQHIAYLDHRTLNADDVNLTILSNSMKIKRLNGFDDINKTQNKKRKGDIIETSIAEGNRLDHQMQADDYKINNLDLEDKVNFSTITINLYQAEQISKTILPNPEKIKAYEPNIIFKIWDSIKIGWFVIETILVFLFKFWSIILLGLFIYWILKKGILNPKNA